MNMGKMFFIIDYNNWIYVILQKSNKNVRKAIKIGLYRDVNAYKCF
jgi:hypothetical protein